MPQQNSDKPFVFQIGDLFRLMKASFEAEEGPEVTRAQAKLLISVWRNPGISQQALAQRLDIATMSVCRQIDALEERGMIERRPSDTDRRVKCLYVTEKTSPIISTVMNHVHEISEMFLDPLSAEERKTFQTFLNRIVDSATSRKAGGRK
ncbi:MarR family winged helix-turn-helix transcriptional regulator [Kordiimonas aestuarii]|uniref:MarR family winged helix-turn-helix transcriptional regulator n=1 Tax=Kordiimonas aestuarii TaxID=1005925 RepID=UPI0021D34790|nr:MarR family transcriptional regulator [Kordiimonas aestuarii]